MIFAGLVVGPLAGALAGAATEGLTTDRVWRHRLFGAARSPTEGFAARAWGPPPGVGVGGDAFRIGGAFGAATTPEVALKRADVAVYRAKQERNVSVVEAHATCRVDVRTLVPVRIDRR